jgi:hypothetical protein
MSNKSIEKQDDNGGIDLLDLLIVLIRYRIMIIVSFVTVSIIALIGYFFYPEWKYNNAIENQMIEATMIVESSPALLALDIEYNLKNAFANVPLIYSTLKEAGYTKLGPDDSFDLNERNKAYNMIRQYYIRNQDLLGNPLLKNEKILIFNGEASDEINEDLNKNFDNSIIEISYRNVDAEKSIDFLNLLYRNANTRLVNSIKPQLETIVNSYERLVFISNQEVGYNEVIIEGLKYYDAAKKVIEENSSVLILKDPPYIFRDEISLSNIKFSYMKMALIFITTILIFTILFSFLLNAIDNVKKDEDSMMKIKNALGK